MEEHEPSGVSGTGHWYDVNPLSGLRVHCEYCPCDGDPYWELPSTET